MSFDWCYAGFDPESNDVVSKDGRSNDDDVRGLLCCLVAHDSSTGSVLAVPCESKSSTRQLGVELMRFIQSLGHAAVQIKCDAEPATLSLQRAIVTARQRLGLKTLEQNPPLHQHQANGAVEKSIDLIRKLAMTLVQCVRDKAQVEVNVSHPLFCWSFVHAAWLRNRFAVKGGLTSYERCTGNAYTGRLAAYGEPVFAEVIPRKKGNARFVKALFLTKATANDMCVVASKAGVRVCRSIRRTCSEWSVDKVLFQEVQGFPWQYSSAAVGARLVPPAKTRKPQPADVQDEAASLPPTTPGGVSAPASVAESIPVLLPMNPPSVVPSRVPPPEGATALPTESRGVTDPNSQGEANPSLRAPMPGTPEYMLPVMGSPDVARTEPTSESMQVEEPRENLDDRAPKVPRIRTVHFGGQDYEINDETLNDAEFEEIWDAEAMIWSYVDPEGDTDDSDEVPSAADVNVAEDNRLWFPNEGREPDLSAEAMQELDMLADAVEVSRLVAKGVLREACSEDSPGAMKSLSTKMVRTWRSKRRNGQPMFYRRSRLCAREFRWLDASKEGLFSPATSSDIVQLIPALFLSWKQTRPDVQYAIVSLDVKDAYLEVDQPEPVVSKIEVSPGVYKQFVFQKMIPGQREGSSRWFQHFVAFLSEHFQVTQCPVCPAIIKTPEGPGMIHVDDSLLLLPLDWAVKVFLPVVKISF